MSASVHRTARHVLRPITSFVLAIVVLACGAEPPTSQSKPVVADIDTADCALLDESGRGEPISLGELHDPIARLVLSNGCPTDFAAVTDKLARVDTEACDGGMFAADRTTMISELAQLRGVATGDLEGCTGTPAAFYRGVMQRTCGGREPWELLFSVMPTADTMPADLEAIAWDREREEMAFYTLEEGTWRFFGHSRDMVRGPADTGERRCAACHVAGGLVMKELDAPWLHWEGRLTTPGVDTILSAHAGLGSRTAGKVIDFRPAGKELEEAIVAGNAAWVRTRVAHLRDVGTTRELLRPLFCTVEVNLGAGSDTATPTDATGNEPGALELPVGLLLDPRLAPPARVPIPLAHYHAAIVAAGQRMEWSCGASLFDEKGRAIVDTPFDLAFPHRARIDVQHVDALVREGIVDEELVTAVLGVDLTRPIFSTARCGLLDRMAELPPAQRNAAAIRAALVAAVVGDAPESNDAAAQLRANLERPRGVKARAAAFVDACLARPTAELATDIVRFTSWARDEAREQPVLEFRETLPVDDLHVADGTHFDPVSCRLITDAAG